jgi:chemotaxis protein MotB
LRTRNGPPEDEKAKVPGYIVTFSDMVTLLLTFFVLLLTLATVQDPDLFHQGRDSFWQSIHLCGLGVLLGNNAGPDFEAPITKYRTTEPETAEDRTLDEYREKLRRIFERLNQSMTTLPSQIVGRRLDFSITPVRFGRGEALLNDSARAYLSTYCLDLRQNVRADSCTLYVLGLAGDEVTEMQQWTLSARRAQAVARFLQEQLDQNPVASPPPNAAPWRVLWWGAGPGGHWAGQDQPDPGQSQILIAMLRSGL